MAHNVHDVFKDQFNDFLDQIGIWVIYTRSDPRFRCKECFDLNTRDSPANCSSCFGTGFKVNLERWLVYPSNSLNFPAPVEAPLIRPGILSDTSTFIFSRATERPVVGDRVFIVEWNESRDLIVPRNASPVSIVQVLRIHFVEPLIAGQVIYYTSHCKFVTEAIHQYEQALAEVPIRISRA
jgi:hypothetical protein